MSIKLAYVDDIQSHEFPLLFKEGWPGMLISGYFTQLIDRPGWLIVLTEGNSDDNMVLVITLWISVVFRETGNRT
jgi:hypothetical protein